MSVSGVVVTHEPDADLKRCLAALAPQVAELVVVTALRAPEIRDSLRHLRKRKAIVKTDRDGKAAYALPAAEAR